MSSLEIISSWAWMIFGPLRTGVSLEPNSHSTSDMTARQMNVVFIGTGDFAAFSLSLSKVRPKMNSLPP